MKQVRREPSERLVIVGLDAGNGPSTDMTVLTQKGRLGPLLSVVHKRSMLCVPGDYDNVLAGNRRARTVFFIGVCSARGELTAAMVAMYTVDDVSDIEEMD